jgi:hypothetical protein
MTGRRRALLTRRARITVMLAVGATLTLTAAAAAWASTTAPSAGAAITARSAPPAPVHTVALPTGEVVTLGLHPGNPVAAITAGHGAFESFPGANGDQFIVPAEAVPYLGRQLDPSLFDVAALSRGRAASTGSQIPVNLSFATGSPTSAPPGVTLTSTATSSAVGYLTPQSGAAFAAGLRAAIGADVRAGRQPGSGPLFGGLASMSLAAPATAAAATQPFPLHILQLEADDLTGAPVGTALAFVMNTDAYHRWWGFEPVFTGLARIAVPAGNYFATVLFLDFDAQGNETAVRHVTRTDFAVSNTAATTSISFDERTAFRKVAVMTPRPATQDVMSVAWDRRDATGATLAPSSIVFGSQPPFFTNDQPPASVGAFHYVVQWGGAGPSTGDQYRYDLAFGADRIAPDQSYQPGPDQIATVRHTLYSDPATTPGGLLLVGAVDEFSPGGGILLSGQEAYSGALTEYTGAGDGGRWAQWFINSFGTFIADVHTFAGSGEYQVEWAHDPLAARVGRHSGPQQFSCFACASATAMTIGFSISGDSEPDHVVLPNSVTSFFTLFENGGVAGEFSNAREVELTGTPTTPTTFRAVFDPDFSGVAGVSQSTHTHIDLTFVYAPSTDPADTLPATDTCDDQGLLVAPCQILPLLDLNYHLPTDTLNSSGSAQQVMRLHVDHLGYDGHGSHAPITGATVSVSFDGGVTWTPATVTGTNGNYLAAWTNPVSAEGTSPDLLVTAQDTVGGSISETVTNAYTVATSVR